MGGSLSYTQMKVNSTLSALVIESGIGKNSGNPQVVV